MAVPADSKKLYLPLETIGGVMDANGNYVMRPLDLKNLNDNIYYIGKKIQGGITLADITKLAVEELRAGVVISNTVITTNLYATYGVVTELIVDWLNTLNKVARYWAADTTEADFIDIHAQTLASSTGTVVKIADVPQTEQLNNRYGQPLYYREAATAENYMLVGMDTAPTAFPVMVYQYIILDKLVLGHVYDAGEDKKLPQIVLGAGAGVEGHPDWGKAYITKRGTRLDIKYITDTGEETPITFTDFVDAKHRRVKDLTWNKSTGKLSVLKEGESTPEDADISVVGNTVTITRSDGFIATAEVIP